MTDRVMQHVCQSPVRERISISNQLYIYFHMYIIYVYLHTQKLTLRSLKSLHYDSKVRRVQHKTKNDMNKL